MIIAIFGAHGFSGGNIAAEALARGHQVVAVSRRGLPDPRPGVTVRQGSLFDEDLFASVAAEADAVVLAVPALSDSGSLPDAVPELLRIAGRHGARLGVVGGAGSLLSEPGGPAMYDGQGFPEAYRENSKAQGRVLDALRTAPGEEDWFYLSPAAGYGKHTPGERTGRFRLGGDVVVRAEDGTSYVSGADLAIALVDELENPKHTRARFTVGY